MMRLRRIARNSPALAVAVLALFFALGGGAGYAASTRYAASSGQAAASSAGRVSRPHRCAVPLEPIAVFHRLKLMPGWQGDAEYTVLDGVIYLDGAVVSSKHNVTEIARLPKAYADLSPIALPAVYGQVSGRLNGYDGGVGIVNGIIYASPRAGSGQFQLWLSGLSFIPTH